MSWTFTTSGSAIIYAGANYNTAQLSGSVLQGISDDAEGFICVETRFDFLTNYASLNAAVKQALAAAANSYIGLVMVNYDMSGYTSRLEAENMLDVNFDRLTSMINVLKDFKTTTLRTP